MALTLTHSHFLRLSHEIIEYGQFSNLWDPGRSPIYYRIVEILAVFDAKLNSIKQYFAPKKE